MQRSLPRTIAVVACGLLLFYLAYLVFIAVRANSLLQDARSTYNQFQADGLSEEVETKYRELLPKAQFLRVQLENPLLTPILKPLISFTNREKQLNEATDLYDEFAPLLPVVPAILGVERPQRFLVAFQNSAEARGTGGIIGAFAILNFDRGKISVEQVGSNFILQSQPTIPIQMPDEFYRIYRQDPAIWQNSNMSPHFPYGAKIWLALWEDQFDDRLDGVIALDPIALSHLLKVTGPLEAKGQTITSENVVRESLSDAYLRYEKDNLARKTYLVAIIEAVAKAVLDPSTDRLSLLKAVREPIFENRILLYSDDAKTQQSVRQASISGVFSPAPSNEYRLVIQNTAGNKMDYYIDRTLTITSKSCAKRPTTEVRFTITNTAERTSYLPAYVKGRLDLNLPEGKENSTAIAAFLYGPPNAKLVSAEDTGKSEAVGFVKTERTRQAFTIPLDLAPLESRTFIATFKGGQGPLTTHIQPLVIDQKTEIIDRCAA